MSVSVEALITIIAVALITFAIRAGGLMLANRLPETGFAAAWIKHIPAAVLAALVAPAVASGKPAELIGTAIATLAYLITRNLFATMIAGVLAVYLGRLWLGF